MNAITILTMLASALVVIRMLSFINHMHVSCVPCGVLTAGVALAVGAGAFLLSPMYGDSYTWRDAVFAIGAATWVWMDRRGPCHPTRQT